MRAWPARAFSFALSLQQPAKPCSPHGHEHHHRPIVLSAGDTCHRCARARQGRVCRIGDDLNPAACAATATIAGGGNPAADPALPRRDLGMGLSARLVRLESQGPAARLDDRRSGGMAVRGLCRAGLCRACRGRNGDLFVIYTFLAHVPMQPQRPSAAAGMFWGSLAGFTSTSSRSAARPTMCTSCRNGSTNSL